ncbi:MoxR family ATPase, partial [Acinetobacter baumannii]
EGTYPLPEAQLDRFLFKVVIGYPSLDEERNLLSLVTQGRVGDVLDVDQLTTVVNADAMTRIQKIAANVRVDREVRDY